MTAPTAPANRLLVLDFDGTVCVGDAPVWAYAEAAIATLRGPDTTRSAAAGIATEIRTRLAGFLDGEHTNAGLTAPYVDGYGAVAAIAGEFITPEQLHAAFVASRRALADGDIAVETPTGLADFLNDLGATGVRRVLVTNSPGDGIAETLVRLGLTSSIDRIVTNAAKPSGWELLLPELLVGREPSDVLSVGDIWRNDLEAPRAAGCATAFIDRFGQATVPATLVAPRFEALYDGILAWATDFSLSSPVLEHPSRKGMQ